jgi:putative FmdB family regulatory protein
MPQYEFVCKDCKKPFSKFLAISEYDKGQMTCPTCGSNNVEQQLSPFYVVTSRKSAA